MQKYKIGRKEATLYVNSKISESLPWLKKKLTKNKEYPFLTTKEYDLLNDSQKNFINTRFEDLFRKAFSEWNAVFDKTEKTTDQILNCELCGQKDIKLLSKLENVLNHNTLIVGSSCIDEFAHLKDAHGKTLEQIRKKNDLENNKIRNENLLEEKIPNLLNNIDKFNKFMSENEYFIKTDIEKKYYKINEDISTKYNKYMNQKDISDKKIAAISEINEDILRFFDAYGKYIDECEKNIFGLNKDICKWCTEHLDESVIDLLKKEGKITKNTIAHIKEPKFLSKMILQFCDLFKSNNLLLKSSNIGSIFKISTDAGTIYFDVNSSDFIDIYKDYLFDKNENKNTQINKEYLISKATITDGHSKNNALDKIAKEALQKCDYQYKFGDLSLNEAAFYKITDKKVYVLELEEFVNQFATCILKDRISENSKNVVDYINKKSEVYSYNEYREHLNNMGVHLRNFKE